MFDKEKMKQYMLMKIRKYKASSELVNKLADTGLLDGTIVYDIEEKEEYSQFEKELFKVWFPELNKVWQERQWNEGEPVYQYSYKELVDGYCNTLAEYEEGKEWDTWLLGDVVITFDRVSIDEWINLLEQEYSKLEKVG